MTRSIFETPRPGRTQVRYDAGFLDIDGTLLWVDLDVEGYVEDLAPYSGNGGLSAERVLNSLWGACGGT